MISCIPERLWEKIREEGCVSFTPELPSVSWTTCLPRAREAALWSPSPAELPEQDMDEEGSLGRWKRLTFPVCWPRAGAGAGGARGKAFQQR